MNLTAKKVLSVDLEKGLMEVGNFTNLHKYVGGVGLGLKLFQMYEEKDPIIFSVGPLNGFFPYVSKTSIVLNDAGVIEDLYLGGSLSTRLKFAGLDAVVFLGASSEEVIADITNLETMLKPSNADIANLGLPGKRSILTFFGDKLLLDQDFTSHEYILEKKFALKKIAGMVVTGSEIYKVKEFDRYKELYAKVLAKESEMTVTRSDKPSCSGCPMGCEKSRFGELGGNVLVHSLVACQFAERIYADLGIAFSCLNSVGYDYTHEDLENLPKLVEETLKAIS
jgi:aldehyde:ferredoxin oxidoreductase